MCMTDDDCCNDLESVYGPGGGIAGGTPAGSAAATSTGKICKKCLFFWLLVLAAVFGALYYYGKS